MRHKAADINKPDATEGQSSMTVAESRPKHQRLYYLDWLRVLVILNLIPFHALWLMTYIKGFSYIPQEGVVVTVIKYYITFVAYWHMPLLFFITGTTTYISLNYRSITEYVKERTKRLFIPLVFFVLVCYPLPVYFLPGAAEDRSLSDYLFRFWPQCLKTPHNSWPVGRPALPGWGHLWFVGYLLVISLVTLPLLLYCKKHLRRGLTDKSVTLITRRGGIFLPGIFFVVIIATLTPIWPLFYQHNLYQDWTYFFYNLVVFIWGFVFCLDVRFGQAVDRHLKLSLPLAMVSSVIVLVLRYEVPALSTPAYGARYFFYATIFGFNTWFWILALLGLARRYLSSSNALLKYFNRASYPFYILHLSLMIPIGFVVVQWQTSGVSEFLIISILSFMVIIGVYEILVKRMKFTRFLFGMKA